MSNGNGLDIKIQGNIIGQIRDGSSGDCRNWKEVAVAETNDYKVVLSMSDDPTPRFSINITNPFHKKFANFPVRYIDRNDPGGLRVRNREVFDRMKSDIDRLLDFLDTELTKQGR